MSKDHNDDQRHLYPQIDLDFRRECLRSTPYLTYQPETEDMASDDIYSLYGEEAPIFLSDNEITRRANETWRFASSRDVRGTFLAMNPPSDTQMGSSAARDATMGHSPHMGNMNNLSDAPMNSTNQMWNSNTLPDNSNGRRENVEYGRATLDHGTGYPGYPSSSQFPANTGNPGILPEQPEYPELRHGTSDPRYSSREQFPDNNGYGPY